MDLFYSQQKDLPLAEHLRPKRFDEFVGQDHIMSKGASFYQLVFEQKKLNNYIFWGPPGTGKTSLARLISKEYNYDFIEVNAISTGAKALRELGASAHDKKLMGQKTIIFIDEIHRLNKSQQDVLLPFTERSDFYLIGATTENPGYEINAALLSRCRVVEFKGFTEENLESLLHNAFKHKQLKSDDVFEDKQTQQAFLAASLRDGRKLLSQTEILFELYEKDKKTFPLNKEALFNKLDSIQLYYDKTGEEHYNCISAFIKSIRGSDADAGLYYLARMLKSGEDPIFIARRLVILASEDVGNADPRALTLATSGLQAVELVGMPEAGINLAQVVTYLASAPKSNRSYLGYKKALSLVEETGQLPIPKSLRSSKNKVAKQLGYGKDYKYSHNYSRGWADQQFLPEQLSEVKLYEPQERGFEKNILEYQKWLKQNSKPKNDD